jgi:tRNA pseudouridine55 synthase
VGQATRLIEYLDDARKAYVAQLRFGVSTNTYDADGEVMVTSDASGVTAGAVEARLREFEGEIEQVPPAFSAIKLAGQPLYRYARAGKTVEIPPRRVFVESVRMHRFDASVPVAEIEVVCSKGTYIRSIANDLGRKLGCGAHLVGLRRTESGGFGIDQAWSPDQLAVLEREGRLEEALLAPDRAVERRDAAIVGREHAAYVVAGRDVEFVANREVQEGGICRAYDTGGRFLGVLVGRAAGKWHPVKVLVPG